MRWVLLPLLCAMFGVACGASESSTPEAQLPSGSDPNGSNRETDPMSPTDSGSRVDASRDGGRDAGARDAGPTDAASMNADASSNGWTPETTPIEIAQHSGQLSASLLGDPYTPRRLLLRFSLQPGVNVATTPIAFVWTSGQWSKPLFWSFTASPQFLFDTGGGFAADGTLYTFIEASPSVSLATARVASYSSGAWDWKSVAQNFGSWPPRKIHIMPGSPLRAFLKSDSTLIEIATAGNIPADDVTELGLSPDRTSYLGVPKAGNGLTRCVIATNVCTAVAASGIDPKDELRAIRIAPSDGSRVFVDARRPAPSSDRVLYVSKDAGATFAKVPLPQAVILETPLHAPNDLDTLVVQRAPSGLGGAGVSVTHDLGQTWTDVPLPGAVGPIEGVALDASGTLFLIRNGQLFSRALP